MYSGHTRWIGLAAVALLSLAVPASLDSAAGVPGSPHGSTASPVSLIDLHLVGAAAFTPSGRILLVQRGGTDSAGAAYTATPVHVEAFTVKLVFDVVGACADGLALVVQDEGPDALGATGGDLGYGRQTAGDLTRSEGITHSIAVELDTWQNRWDPAVPHVSLQSRGVRENDTDADYSLVSKAVGPVEDRHRHRLTVHYRDGILHVWYGGQRIINNHIDLTHHLDLSDGTAYVGVTAANGACASDTTLDDFHFFESAR